MLVVLLTVALLALSSAQRPNEEFVVANRNTQERQPVSGFSQELRGGQNPDLQVEQQQQKGARRPLRPPQQPQEPLQQSQQSQEPLQQSQQPQEPLQQSQQPQKVNEKILS
ncbi:gliadoralin-A-like [Arvicola amphibius]|uniref:gliadoralin-A-like n=1 Tax=Arvicola amphibius TaxID=1047088 RepID=UPI0018E3E5BD|nr:gliadoralin-A-like [Arvicola amphibius]